MNDQVPSSMLLLRPFAEDHWRHSAAWWEREAYLAVEQHRSRIIPARNNRDVYLLRFWLHTPKIGPEQGLESGESVMLHLFARADDDASLHDHPWNFRTTILVGAYDENLPPKDWDPLGAEGPEWDQRIVPHHTGDTMEHDAIDLHCVGRVDPGTWTLVRTGARTRSWGFHPPGGRWQPWRDYLDAARLNLPLSA